MTAAGGEEFRSIFIDETGDRGDSSNASPIFGMAAILLDKAAEQAATAAITRLRTDLDVPAGNVLSWKANIKSDHAKANHAARVLSERSR